MRLKKNLRMKDQKKPKKIRNILKKVNFYYIRKLVICLVGMD